jgi:5-methylcytosine-specific restriction endonuclease McrA
MSQRWLQDDEISRAEKATKLDIEELRRRIKRRLRTMAFRIKNYGLDRETNRISAVEAIRLFNLMDWKCAYCGIKLDLSLSTEVGIFPDQLTIDHIQPLTRNGVHRIDNITCACRKCNHMKAGLTVKLFLDDDPKKVDGFYSKHKEIIEIYRKLPEVIKE